MRTETSNVDLHDGFARLAPIGTSHTAVGFGHATIAFEVDLHAQAQKQSERVAGHL